MENAFARYEGISVCWIEKCTFISGIVAMARIDPDQFPFADIHTAGLWQVMKAAADNWHWLSEGRGGRSDAVIPAKKSPRPGARSRWFLLAVSAYVTAT